jgi:hypothetical protein
VSYLTRLFSDPEASIENYSDEQLNQGLWYLASNAASNHMFALLAEQVSINLRQKCIESIYSLFAELFTQRCSPHLSHLDEPGANPLNLVCYM